MEGPNNKYKKEVFANFALISQLGINVMVPPILGVVLGVYIDGKLNTFFTIPFLIIGFLAGGRNAYVLAQKANVRGEAEKKYKEEEELVNTAISSWKNKSDEDN